MAFLGEIAHTIITLVIEGFNQIIKAAYQFGNLLAAHPLAVGVILVPLLLIVAYLDFTGIFSLSVFLFGRMERIEPGSPEMERLLSNSTIVELLDDIILVNVTIPAERIIETWAHNQVKGTLLLPTVSRCEAFSLNEGGSNIIWERKFVFTNTLADDIYALPQNFINGLISFTNDVAGQNIQTVDLGIDPTLDLLERCGHADIVNIDSLNGNTTIDKVRNLTELSENGNLCGDDVSFTSYEDPWAILDIQSLDNCYVLARNSTNERVFYDEPVCEDRNLCINPFVFLGRAYPGDASYGETIGTLRVEPGILTPLLAIEELLKEYVIKNLDKGFSLAADVFNVDFSFLEVYNNFIIAMQMIVVLLIGVFGVTVMFRVGGIS